MQIIYLKAFLFCILIVLGSSIVMENTPPESKHLPVETHSENLEFINQRGSATTQAQVLTFINFINAASNFYKNDTKARLSYISDKMNAEFSDSSQYGFSVIQMDNQTISDSSIYTITNKYASVSAGVDRIFPQNSYMFTLDPDYLFGTGRVYFDTVGQKGNGVDWNLQIAVKNAILYYETTPTCQCLDNPLKIKLLLIQYDRTYWSVFCSASNSFKAAVYPKNQKYISIKPKNCYYILYEM